MPHRSAFPLLVLCLVTMFGLATPATGGEPPKSYFVDVPLDDLAQAAKLSEEGFDVAGVDRTGMAAGVVGSADDLARLSALGWVYTIRKVVTSGEADLALSDYTDPQELSAFLTQVQTHYPTRKSPLAMSPSFK